MYVYCKELADVCIPLLSISIFTHFDMYNLQIQDYPNFSVNFQWIRNLWRLEHKSSVLIYGLLFVFKIIFL